MAKPIRESMRRWWFDRHGQLWINVRAVRRRPMSIEEWWAIDEIMDERRARVGDNNAEAVH